MKTIIFGIILPLIVIVILIGVSGSGAPTSNEPVSVVDAFYPEPTNYVVDSAGVLSADFESRLNGQLGEIKAGQIGVAVVKTTSPLTIEEYGIRLAEKWKVGHAGKDDGVILIVATDDRKVRIEVGKGAEANITDSTAGTIMDVHIIPKFKTGDWEGGILDGVLAIQNKLSN